MAMAKRSHSNPWMPAAIATIFFCVLAIAAAIYFYLDADKKALTIEELETQNRGVFNSSQWNSRGELVGTIPSGKNMVDMLLEDIDQMTQLMLGEKLEDKNAEMKLQDINNKITLVMDSFKTQYPEMASVDVKTIGMVGMISRLKTALDAIITQMEAQAQQIENYQLTLEQTEKIANDTLLQLQQDKDALSAKAQQIQTSYDELEALMKKSTTDQVQLLLDDLEKARVRIEELTFSLSETEAKYKVASDMLKDARAKLATVTGRPDVEPQIREADGNIIMLDEVSKVVHLDIGKADRVYPGLTFGVYDRNVPIPSDGKGKAEVQVFNVDENISVAKIVSSDIKNPILNGDIVANLVWSTDQVNLFVVSGEFDLDGDGLNDYESDRKIKGLIEMWGGKVQPQVTVNTSFIVLGTPPRVLPRPTYDEISIDPLAMEKYENSLKSLEQYKTVKEQAEKLQIPLLNYERFLYLIGYKNEASRPGAFSR